MELDLEHGETSGKVDGGLELVETLRVEGECTIWQH